MKKSPLNAFVLTFVVSAIAATVFEMAFYFLPINAVVIAIVVLAFISGIWMLGEEVQKHNKVKAEVKRKKDFADSCARINVAIATRRAEEQKAENIWLSKELDMSEEDFEAFHKRNMERIKATRGM